MSEKSSEQTYWAAPSSLVVLVQRFTSAIHQTKHQYYAIVFYILYNHLEQSIAPPYDILARGGHTSLLPDSMIIMIVAGVNWVFL